MSSNAGVEEHCNWQPSNSLAKELLRLRQRAAEMRGISSFMPEQCAIDPSTNIPRNLQWIHDLVSGDLLRHGSTRLQSSGSVLFVLTLVAS